MAFLMFAVLAALVIIAYFVGKRDLLSPWFLLCLALFVSYSIVMLNYENWEVKINEKFMLYVCTALLAWGIGGFLMRTICFRNEACSSVLYSCYIPEKRYKKYPINLFAILSVILAMFYISKMLIDAGDAPSFSQRIRNIYDNIVANNYSPGFVFNQMMEIVTAIAYISVYRLLKKIYSKNDKISVIKLLIPIIAFLFLIIVSTDRNIFLRFAFYSICLYVFFFSANYKKKNPNRKIIKRVVIMLLAIIIVFFLFGRIKKYSSDITGALSIYGGSGLYNFNLWIEEFSEPLMYGNSTFSTFLNTLDALFKPFGLNFSHVSIDRFDPFIEYTAANGYVYSSNIYSALKPFVEDFGYFGVIIFPLIMGILYEFLFLKSKKRSHGFSWVLYCLLIYPIMFFPILEQLFRRLHLGMLYEIGWVAIAYFFAFRRKKKKAYVCAELFPAKGAVNR